MFNINADNDIKKKRTIAKIKGGKYDNKIITYLPEDSDDDKIYRTFHELLLTNDSKFEPFPNLDIERSVLYIAGPSGSGKSFYTKMYLKNYIKQYPENGIYMFSKLTEDSSLDDVKEIKRIKIDNRLITMPLDVNDFKDSLVIFDDIDCIKNKEQKAALNDLKNEILETGRHSHTTILITSHLACKGAETRSILNEAHSITLFPGSGMPIDYLLQNYVGLDKKQIQNLKNIPSRWITLLRQYPQMLLTEHSVRFMKDL